jgi:hypothetical protein
LGARFFAGEKCCWRVEKAGRLNCDSVCGGCAFGSSAPFLVGGRRATEDVRIVEEDFVRVCPGSFEPAERVLADALRRWRDCVSGGLDRSFFAGSESVIVGGGFGRRPENDLCNPPVVGLLIFARVGGGRIEELLVTLPVALGGLEMVRVGGLGSRLGDWPVLSGRDTIIASPASTVVRSYLLPASAGLRRDRVLEGSADIVSVEVVLLTLPRS